MKRIVDIITVVLLALAFILAYYTGFVSKSAVGEPVLATNTLALISVLGTLVLFVVGGAATAYDRFKRGLVTKSFVALFAVQIFALVGMMTVMLFLSLDMFQTDNTVIRFCYMVFAMVSVIGYVDAMLYGDSMATLDADTDEADGEDGEYGFDDDAEEDSEYGRETDEEADLSEEADED